MSVFSQKMDNALSLRSCKPSPIQYFNDVIYQRGQRRPKNFWRTILTAFLHKIVLNQLKNVPAVKMSKNYFGTHVRVYLHLAWNAIRYFIRDPLSSTYELTLWYYFWAICGTWSACLKRENKIYLKTSQHLWVLYDLVKSKLISCLHCIGTNRQCTDAP